ncbi:putative galacturonosyltransferase 12-like isoform X1 [Hibiscus syriacus]|uniref:Galacturonosyltransferase 12-like isoform X1 n=1 Tax=Hibiscus syriacus TaxID=106335 RepID=A0A6A2Y4X1_HIBSY|nr:putative galacturonosyltransferase 12-like isoform X1 [Hibiscus syriacus]
MVSPENSNYWSPFDYATLIDDIPVPDGSYSGFSWSTQPINAPSTAVNVEIDCSFGDSDGLKESGPKKRGRSESCNPSSTKACREKLRRDRLNDKPPKTDKAAILVDAAEKHELRDEKQRLKVDKEKLEQQLKTMNAKRSFIPHAPAIPAAIAAAQGQAPGNKLVPFLGYHGVAM